MKLVFPILGVSLLLTAGLAEKSRAAELGEVFNCKIDTYGYGNWVPRKTSLTFLDSFENVEVSDPYIWESEGGPVVVPVKQRRNGMLRFRWRLNLPTSSGRRTAASYRADFDPESGKGRIHAAVAVFSDTRQGGHIICGQSVSGKRKR
ncbi:hypothetical protein [Leisingera sp. ANG-Vp]|uniref:hypothetical protein n=1 Tax=Leisingera sp. ANG-Vp TaxID=1577896 RepID=UPI00126A6326|nr:hypothetical protein [Leisingera sp. ANG-Vp]